MGPLQLIGPSYNLESRPASVQRTVNLMPVPLEPGNERTGWVFKDVPGLVEFRDGSLDGVLFLDRFDGAADTDVESHTPDIAPTGWTYATVPGYEPIVLAGGRIRSSDENSTGRVDAAGTGLAFEFPYTMKMIGTIPEATGSGSIEEVFFRLEAANGAFVHVGIATHMALETYSARLQTYDANDPTVTFSFDLDLFGTYEVAATIHEDGTVEFFVDDVLVHTVTGFPTFTAIETVTLQTDVDGGGIYTYMDEARITQEEA